MSPFDSKIIFYKQPASQFLLRHKHLLLLLQLGKISVQLQNNRKSLLLHSHLFHGPCRMFQEYLIQDQIPHPINRL